MMTMMTMMVSEDAVDKKIKYDIGPTERRQFRVSLS
jgi:hypothetical protein